MLVRVNGRVMRAPAVDGERQGLIARRFDRRRDVASALVGHNAMIDPPPPPPVSFAPTAPLRRAMWIISSSSGVDSCSAFSSPWLRFISSPSSSRSPT